MRTGLFFAAASAFVGSLSLSAVDYENELEVPEVASLQRIQTQEEQKLRKTRDNFLSLATDEAAAVGQKYMILTDHHEEDYLAALEKLKLHHRGSLIQVDDFNALISQQEKREKLKAQLLETKYLAIAPRANSFRENTVLTLFQLLTELDQDSQIDVFPGFLVSSSPEKLAQIVETAVAYQSVPAEQLRPVAISLVDSKQRINALQKAGYFRKLFAQRGKVTPTYLVYRPQAQDAPHLGHDSVWYQQLDRGKNIIRSFPGPFAKHFQQANLVLMHGHGTVGESCRIATDAFEQDLSGKVILSGSCFSAAPRQFDWPVGERDQFADTTSFSIKALEQGAVASFGHMRLSNGFRYLNPVFEELDAGGSNGEAYHKLLNAAFKYQPEAASGMAGPIEPVRKPAQNSLLYILFGDPALTPFQRKSQAASDQVTE
jgi:hypothetical protein